MKNIKNIPLIDRPREKLIRRGSATLSDKELLAVLLGKGTKSHHVGKVAEKLLEIINRQGETVQLSDIVRIPGIGPAKAALIMASMEFSRRRLIPQGIKISSPAHLLPRLSNYAHQKQEYFLCFSLNGAHEIIASRVVSIGLLNQSQVHPREVFADPITDRAAAVIVAHNHPSGQLEPSTEDKVTTRRLKEAGDIIGIPLLDHIIFSHSGYYSFAENKLL